MNGVLRQSLSVVATSLVVLMTAAAPSAAQFKFIVNSTDDDVDSNTTDSVCSTGQLNAGGATECTLRAAIEQANATTATDTVNFDIPGADLLCSGGICTIQPSSELPGITQSIWIDATGVSGVSCSNKTLKIVLDGTNLTSGSGLKLWTSDSYVAGLVVHSFPGDPPYGAGIAVDGGSLNIISCNLIGVDVDGTTARGNGQAGILQIEGYENVMGVHADDATDWSEGNVIGGNEIGIRIWGGSGNIIAGNTIGANASLTLPIANTTAGVVVQCGSGTIIGSNQDGKADDYEGNRIGGNPVGVQVMCDVVQMNYRISGNQIGWALDPDTLGNTSHGVHVTTSYTSGDTFGTIKQNSIAYNGGAGVAVDVPNDAQRHEITENAISGNGGIGIDLGSDGSSTNDPNDDDEGPNQLQNTPVFTVVQQPTAGELWIKYYVDSDPTNSSYPLKVEFFQTAAGDDEGQMFVGSDTYSDGDYSDCGTPPCIKAWPGGDRPASGFSFVATATDLGGRTSEFSSPVPVADNVIAISAKAFLEGPYAGSAMSTTLQSGGHLPLSQPFADDAYNSTVLDFDGTQSMPSTPTAVDWVLVSLRAGTDVGTLVAGSEQAAVIHADGMITTPNDDSLRFAGVANGSYYLVVCGRNHLDVMSSGVVDVSDGTGSWDFTTASSQAYGINPMKDLGGGLWGLFACDANCDGQATAPDFNLWNASTTAGEIGYRQADCNMDGIVTAPDFNLWNANTTAGASSQVPD